MPATKGSKQATAAKAAAVQLARELEAPGLDALPGLLAAIGRHHAASVDGTAEEARTALRSLPGVADRVCGLNPGSNDIMTHTPDAANGRLEQTGLGKEFMSRSALERRLSFTVEAGTTGTSRRCLPHPRTPRPATTEARAARLSA